MRECAANNILSTYEDELEDVLYDEGRNFVTDDAERMNDIILDYADENIEDVDVYETKISIYYGDGSYNVLEIFDFEVEEDTRNES